MMENFKFKSLKHGFFFNFSILRIKTLLQKLKLDLLKVASSHCVFFLSMEPSEFFFFFSIKSQSKNKKSTRIFFFLNSLLKIQR